MKKHELFFSSLKIPLDFWVVWISFFLAKEIRLVSDWIPWIQLPIKTIDNQDLQIFALYGALLYIFLFSSHRLYSIQISGSKVWEVLDIIRYGIYWFLFYSVWVYFWNEILYSEVDIPRLIILFTTILSIVFSICIRIMLNSIQAFLLRISYLSKRNILIISSKWSRSIRHILDDIISSRVYHIIWYANPEELKWMKDFQYYNSITDIEELAQNNTIDEILYIDSDFSKQNIYKLWEISQIFGIRYRYITNNFDVTKTNTSLSFINKTPVIEILGTPLQDWWRIIKRLFDICFSLLHIIVLSPIFLIISLLIKIDDPWAPIIYKNSRVWLGGKLFHCYKFRYIRWGDCIKESYGVKLEEDPAYRKEQELIKTKSSRKWALYKIQNDPRKTKIWTILEKYSLDELPQLFNVLRGDMSIIGPRPHQPREVKRYHQYQKRLLTVRPWITWMAQVHGREKNNFEKEAKLDIFYIENWSILLDLKLLCKTYPLVFLRK